MSTSIFWSYHSGEHYNSVRMKEDPFDGLEIFDLFRAVIVIFSQAIMVFGVINTVQCWALHKRGPVFVAMFKPLQMIIAAVLGIMFLGDALRLGSYYMSIPSSPRLDRYVYRSPLIFRLHAQALTLAGLVGAAAV